MKGLHTLGGAMPSLGVPGPWDKCDPEWCQVETLESPSSPDEAGHSNPDLLMRNSENIITHKHLRHHRARLRNGQVAQCHGGWRPWRRDDKMGGGVLGVGAPRLTQPPSHRSGQRGSWESGGSGPPPLLFSEAWQLPSSLVYRHHYCSHIS